jgi:membrane protein YqaA with SNARE-associated domain
MTEDTVTDKLGLPRSHSRLVRFAEVVAQHRYATWILAAIAFADSSFLPVAPDLLLIPMALVRPKQVWSLALICTIASALGAGLGYVIGYELWSLIGAKVVEFYGYTEGFASYQRLVEEWGVWFIIAKALTPIPFKIMAIAAGVAAMNPVTFMVAAIIGRALHFAMVAVLIVLWGKKLMVFIEKYEAPLALVSVLVLIGLGIFLYLR